MSEPSRTLSPETSPGGPTASAELLRRAREGDAAALDALFARQLPPLHRWASGRLPQWARDLADTTDLIHDAVLQTVRRIDGFTPRRERALQHYLRRAVANRIHDEYRRVARRPGRPPDAEQVDRPDPAPTPLQLAEERENQRRLRAALGLVSPDERALIVGRVYRGESYEHLARVTGRDTPDAARLAVRRALLRLAQAMSTV